MATLLERIGKATSKFVEDYHDWTPEGTYIDEDTNFVFVASTKPGYLQITMARYECEEYPEELTKADLESRHWRKIYEKAITHFFLTGAANPQRKIVFNTLDFMISPSRPTEAGVRYLDLGI